MAITPYLLYEDVESAMSFLSDAFGFRQQGRAMLGPDGRVQHAAMKLGADSIMMGCPGSQYKSPKRLGHHTQSLYVNVRNVDRHCARARAAGAKIIEEPMDTFYGHRRYGAEDPEGHQWYFAHEIRAPRRKKRAAGRSKK